MRYAVVSDIHANLQAWNAVLLDIRSMGIDRIVCLGDVVGYGPNPAQVLRSVHRNVDHLVLGNHDAVVCGKMDEALFNERAREIIVWTRQQLNREAVGFLRTLPLSLMADWFRCAHGEFSEPEAFNYVIDPQDAVPSWERVEEQLLFIGHSHQPAIFLLGQSRTPRVVEPQDFALEAEKRYLVNVGSVGQPRDGDPRSSYCIFDEVEASVCWRRIPFDLDEYRAALDKAGVSPEASYFLRHDPRQGKPPLREILSFSPASTPDEVVKDAVEVEAISTLKRDVRKWKIMFAAILFAGVTAAAALAFALWSHATRAARIPGTSMAAITAGSAAHDKNLLRIPTGTISEGSAIPGWTVFLGERRHQGVRVDLTAESEPAFVLTSASEKGELRLSSPPVHVRPGMKLCFEGDLLKSDRFDGSVNLVLSLTRKAGGRDDRLDQFEVKEFTWQKSKTSPWLTAKKTTEPLPQGAEWVELQVRGNFAGEAGIRRLSLSRKP
ncbi:metallophosphoesterase family protein [Verrucomicrobiota bacterium]